MLYKLSKHNTNTLLGLPETGIGYQFIYGKIQGDEIYRKYMAFNAEILIEVNRELNFYTNTLIGYCYTMLQDSLSEIHLSEIALVNKNSYEIAPSYKTNYVQLSYSAEDGAKFLRPSIYAQDNRVKQDAFILPGTCLVALEQYNAIQRESKNVFHQFSLPEQEELKRIYHFELAKNDVWYHNHYPSFFGKSGGGDRYLNLVNARILSVEKWKLAGSYAKRVVCNKLNSAL